ncbi:nuclear transport factor 2 family protein [Actinomycetospora sp. TBRC 11914]|uniref:nuclear transport factor 2 family protein n=1 Tax=Actinomycetospora sp. TBRC 11914 TaxID=2729387 RepID=UPI00145E59E8|nr:nuclear transport factor 2 family protein [Actinomycetospora sp. TBRC 11914]NMO93970.1 SnoaL-like domain-containing protein [Actinomycetospora sp. TBRC 11914]
MTTTEQTDTQAILAVLDEVHAAIAAGDAERALAAGAPDTVAFTLAPPLVQPSGSPGEAVAGLAEWIASFAAPPRLAHREPTVHVDGDVAFVHTLTSMSGVKGGEFTLWFRSTYGLRRVDGRWLIVHQHESVPFHMDGSFRAAVELAP